MGARGSVRLSGAEVQDISARLAARGAFRDLERWLSSAYARRSGLLGVERETEMRGQELLRLLFQAHIDARGTGDVGAALRVQPREGDEVLHTHKRLHVRRLITVFGEVRITRMGYSVPGQASIHPLDAELQLPARIYSYEIQRRLVKAAVQGPFDEAVRLLVEMNGIEAPKRSAEQLVCEAAVDFDRFYARRSGSGCLPEETILVGAIDCKGIPMVKPERALRTVRRTKGKKRQKKRMSTVAAVFCQRPEPRTPEQVVASLFAAEVEERTQKSQRDRPQNKRVWASLLSEKTAFIGNVRDEMRARDPERQHPWIIVTDGERALQLRVCELFEDITLVLDLLHVLEKLWKAAHALYREGSPEAEVFVRDRTLRILCGQVSGVIQGLRQIVTKRKLQGAQRKALSAAAAYYYRNRDRMRYDLYLENGWPIASGSVEGAKT